MVPKLPEIKNASYNEQLIFYMGRLGYNSRDFVDTLGLEGIRIPELHEIKGGRRPLSEAETERMAEALMLQPHNGYPREMQGTLEAFREASFKARPLSRILWDIGEKHGAKNIGELSHVFGVSRNRMDNWLQKEAVFKRESVELILEKAPELATRAQLFYEKAGGKDNPFYMNDDHLFEVMGKKHLTSVQVIKALAQNRGIQLKDIGPMVGEGRHTGEIWAVQEPVKPPREKLLRLLGPEGFDLDRHGEEKARKYKKLACRAAETFLDQQHILEDLAEGKITYSGENQALSALMKLKHGTQTAYAAATDSDDSSVTNWVMGTTPTPRERLVTLLDGASDAHKAMAMGKAGHHQSIGQLASAYRGSNQLVDLLEGLKTMYALEDTDLGVHEKTISSWRHFTRSPTAPTLATIFVTMKKDHPEMNELWPTYCDVSARFLGYVQGPVREGFLRKMNASRRAIDSDFKGGGYGGMGSPQ